MKNEAKECLDEVRRCGELLTQLQGEKNEESWKTYFLRNVAATSQDIPETISFSSAEQYQWVARYWDDPAVKATRENGNYGIRSLKKAFAAQNGSTKPQTNLRKSARNRFSNFLNNLSVPQLSALLLELPRFFERVEPILSKANGDEAI